MLASLRPWLLVRRGRGPKNLLSFVSRYVLKWQRVEEVFHTLLRLAEYPSLGTAWQRPRSVLLPTYGEELSTDARIYPAAGVVLRRGELKMTTEQKPASAGVTSAMPDIANGFLLALGVVLYLLGPVGILLGIPLIVTAFAPSNVKKVVAIV
jgi:hypothetical protein